MERLQIVRVTTCENMIKFGPIFACTISRVTAKNGPQDWPQTQTSLSEDLRIHQKNNLRRYNNRPICS